MEAHNSKQTEIRHELLYLAWHIEAFGRQKKLPKLKSILKDTKPKKKLTQEELIEIAQNKGLKVPTKRRC